MNRHATDVHGGVDYTSNLDTGEQKEDEEEYVTHYCN